MLVINKVLTTVAVQLDSKRLSYPTFIAARGNAGTITAYKNGTPLIVFELVAGANIAFPGELDANELDVKANTSDKLIILSR